jgi:hypothetical protein
MKLDEGEVLVRPDGRAGVRIRGLSLSTGGVAGGKTLQVYFGTFTQGRSGGVPTSQLVGTVTTDAQGNLDSAIRTAEGAPLILAPGAAVSAHVALNDPDAGMEFITGFIVPQPPRSEGSRKAASPPPPTLIVDCFWKLETRSWVDTNGNGEWEEQEKPLAGVRFRLRGYETGLSNRLGLAILREAIVPCSAGEVEVSALPPPGYEGGTAQPVKVRGAGDAGTALFGFRRIRSSDPR